MSNNSTNASPSQATAVATTSPGNPIGSVRPGYQWPSDRRIELLLVPTGAFRPLIEEYLTTAAKTTYKPSTLKNIPGSLGKFFRFVVKEERLDSLDRITPETITRFIEAELQRGFKSRNFVGHLSTFFVWAISEHHSASGIPSSAQFIVRSFRSEFNQPRIARAESKDPLALPLQWADPRLQEGTICQRQQTQFNFPPLVMRRRWPRNRT